jgi:hypothetical protein
VWRLTRRLRDAIQHVAKSKLYVKLCGKQSGPKAGYLKTLKRLTKGRLAQLAEHLVYTERVGGSSPSPPTR